MRQVIILIVSQAIECRLKDMEKATQVGQGELNLLQGFSFLCDEETTQRIAKLRAKHIAGHASAANALTKEAPSCAASAAAADKAVRRASVLSHFG